MRNQRRGTQNRPACSNKQIKLEAAAYEDRIGINFSEEYVAGKIGYLANVKPTSHVDANGAELAALILYFITDSGEWFKGIHVYEPYFYVQCEEEYIKEIVFYLNKTFEEKLKSVDCTFKEDLELINHLSGKMGKFIKLSFKNVADLQEVKKELQPIVEKNKAQRETQEAYEGWYNPDQLAGGQSKNASQYLTKITDIREYDVAYHVRTMIDNEIRCAFWYSVTLDGPLLQGMEHLPEKLDKADLRIMAFDIETTKAPLKFPDSKFDQIMMISYIIDGKGFLITNRQVVGEDVADFEYSPKPEYDVGLFKVFNEADEKQLLVRFFHHIRDTKPFIFTTFNGDYFDWPFIQDRAEHYQLKMEEEIGVYNSSQGEVLGRFAAHLDCLYWVKRDAYLPQGSHGLKAVTKAKLGYDPVELDPELMLPYAQEKPQELAEYSVSDSVATFFLYKKMIHDFIFALCTIIPTYPDEVLRRGSGTLCENLLMAQAYRGKIIFPNKQSEKFERFHNGKLIDSDTYIGGTVECLQQGVYRSDIPVKFKLEADGYQRLIDETDDILKFAIEIEAGAKVEDAENYEEVKTQVVAQLQSLKDRCPFLETEPLIYHVDVAAMYPNIILSNRLQPVAIVNEQICAGCTFNKEENNCKRNLEWQWRGEMFPLSRKEFEQVKNQLEYDEENLKGKPGYQPNTNTQSYNEKLKQRVKKYCQTVYKQIHVRKQELKSDTVCMRENPFYVDTVRDFRDRRYEFKRLVKVWVAKFKEAQKEGDLEASEIAKNRMALYESLQLAHKIILNSFYGYVMKKGARWYSMEMAAQVTHAGGSIITDSRRLFDQIGMPLELDTDGIWTLLPKSFPESFSFKMKGGKKVNFDFPCTMCNNLIYEKYGNKQYQTLVNKEKREYETRHEMSIFFEIDGPYKCMLIPASKEEGKMLKKRYAVFNHAGKMTEVKGFELKRRGELKIVKIFQEEVFSKFLEGTTLQECYDACGEVGDRWYDILDSKGEYIDDVEVMEYIGEERVLSKGLSEYGDRKGTSLTCANRLAEFLGHEVLRDGGGLNVRFLISKKPLDAKVAERAIPTAIFDAEKSVKEKYLKKWLKDPSLKEFGIRSLLDWDYYKDRLGGSIQKIVTIPAALQKCMNPIPRIAYPDWLHKRIKVSDDKFKQKELKHFFKVAPQRQITDVEDLQTMGVVSAGRLEQMKQQKEAQEEARKSKEKYSKISECPDPSNDSQFGEWMRYQKTNWRRIRKDFKEHKQILHPTDKGGASKAVGLQTFMRNMDEVILNSTWHIVSVEPTYEPGIMKVWAVTENSTMFAVKLRVPRVIYINSKVPSSDKDFKKVNGKILPRNRPAHTLYEWETSEEQYQDKFHKITYDYLLDNDIEGIYETKMPLIFRAVCQLGTQIRPRKHKIPPMEQAQGRVYSFSELDILQNHQVSYLPSHTYETLYMFHHSQGSRHVLALFNCHTKQINAVIVNPAAKKMDQNPDLSLLKKQFWDTVLEFEQEEACEGWEVVNQWTTNDFNLGLKQLEKVFAEYKTKTKTATLVVLQSDIEPERFQLIGLKTMATEFPVIRYPLEPSDLKFPSLQWIQFAFRNISLRFLEGADWLKQKVDLSRYSCVALGNHGDNSELSVIDTLYARSLALHKHVLWYSNTQMPDLGGHEEKDFRSYFQEEIENPEFVQKGFYRGYTVEIDLRNIATNTILQSGFLKELEEATMAAHQSTGATTAYGSKDKKNQPQPDKKTTEFDTDLDEFVTCQAAFHRLKDLMHDWLNDMLRDDANAELLMSHVYRWITSPNASKLYDPLLHRLVHKLMLKNFYILLRKFKQLGCKVIYGSLHKLFIYTDKYSFDECESQINFVIETLRQNDLFSYIDIGVVDYWPIMLFKDAYNYGGIKESQPSVITAKWDIINHLPQITQHAFSLNVADYIKKVYQWNLKQRKKDKLNGAQLEQDQLEVEAMMGGAKAANKKIESFMDAVDDIKKEPDHHYISSLITQHFSQKLFREVADFMMKKSSDEIYATELIESDGEREEDEYGNEVYADQLEVYDEDDPNGIYERENFQHNKHVLARQQRERARKLREARKWEFPQNIGSHHPYVSPALEFTKFITHHIFGLDDAFQMEANQVKMNLLRMIHCKEFSAEAQEGIEPSLVLVIPDVICSSCRRCSDLDICRDPSLNDEFVQKDSDTTVTGSWLCPDCDAFLNKSDIEHRLLDLVNRRLIAYQIQDLKCKQCQMVKNSVVSKYCECTGAYQQTIGNVAPDKLKNQNLLNQMTDITVFMRLMRNFSNYHNLNVLREVTEQILQVVY